MFQMRDPVSHAGGAQVARGRRALAHAQSVRSVGPVSVSVGRLHEIVQGFLLEDQRPAEKRSRGGSR